MRRLLLIVAFAAGIMALLAVWGSYTAVVALVHLRPVALGAALAAIAAAAAAVLRKDRTRSVAVAAGFAAAALLAVLATLFVPLRTEEVRFQGEGVELAGTLYLPRGGGPFPAVVCIHGSGRQERGEFRWYAMQLARNGIAVLTYDKRGAGQSTGNTYGAPYAAYAADAAAAVRFLRGRDDIRPAAVGLLGHSEGGWVAPLASAILRPQPAFLIVVSTTDLTPAKQVLYETAATLRADGHPEDAVRRGEELQRRVLAYQRSGETDRGLAKELSAAAGEPWFDAAELPRRLYPPEDYAGWRSVMDYDPVPIWRQVDAPVLAISGGRDRNSDVGASQAAIRAALASGGNRDFTGTIYPEMEHGGVEWWLPYRLPPPRYPPGLEELLVRWIMTWRSTAPGSSSGSAPAPAR